MNIFQVVFRQPLILLIIIDYKGNKKFILMVLTNQMVVMNVFYFVFELTIQFKEVQQGNHGINIWLQQTHNEN